MLVALGAGGGRSLATAVRDPARPDQRRPYVLICARLSVISNQTCRRRRRRPPQCYYSARGRAAEYCDARVCLCACKSKSE